ncbi:MAG TPA: glycosyltransferase family 4 protein [Chloroflexota bacterium]|nr:glycosyltransferase family 4 protein [Chloroflexota bacterium]
MQIAYFSPLNPRQSGISDYSEELLPSLATFADLDLFVDGYAPSNPALRERFALYDCAEFAARDAEHPYDVNLYQMGNSLHHAAIYRMLLRRPGVVVLHDVILHHFFLELANRGHDASPYLREMAYAEGPRGIGRGLAVLRGEQPPPLFEQPLIDRVVQASLGIIVHSEHARALVAARQPRRVAVVPAHVSPPPALSAEERRATRADLHLPDEAVVFGAFGLATPLKRLDVALRAFARLHRVMPGTRFLIAGQVDPPGWLDSSIAELNLGDAVVLTGPVPFDRFQRYIQAADACVNLRYPTAGETSASVLRVMAAGVPPIVSDVGSFAELPDACCRKIPVDSTEEERLYETLAALAVDRGLRRSLGEAARADVLASHTPLSTARGYIDFVERVLADAAASPLAPSPSQMERGNGPAPAVSPLHAVERGRG